MTPIRIFVVDDSLVMRTIIGRVVATSPHCEWVGAAPGTNSARSAIAALKPDVITLDLAMPDGDGLQYLEGLRAGPRPAIVVVSAATTVGSRMAATALSLGAEACFDKARILADADLFIETLLAAAGAAYSIRHR